MERSRTMGTVLMAVSALQMLVFTLGVLRRSYYAVAIPVMAVLGAISALLFWVGYTMANMEPDLSDFDEEEEEEPAPQPTATGA
jgi:small neutral amino acid transporter SnatA (MarC family)